MFTPDGKFQDAGVKFLKIVRSGVSHSVLCFLYMLMCASFIRIAVVPIVNSIQVVSAIVLVFLESCSYPSIYDAGH